MKLAPKVRPEGYPTPLPWHAYNNSMVISGKSDLHGFSGFEICKFHANLPGKMKTQRVNRDFTVRATNNFVPLKEALEELLEMLDHTGFNVNIPKELQKEISHARSALETAEGRVKPRRRLGKRG